MDVEKRFPFLLHCWLFLEMPHVTLLLGLAEGLLMGDPLRLP